MQAQLVLLLLRNPRVLSDCAFEVTAHLYMIGSVNELKINDYVHVTYVLECDYTGYSLISIPLIIILSSYNNSNTCTYVGSQLKISV